MKTAAICIFQKFLYLGSVLLTKRIADALSISEADRQKVDEGNVYPRLGVSLKVKDL